MARKCSVCNLEEYRVQIDERLRSGESPAALSREFGFSPDAVARHSKNHVQRQTNQNADLVAQIRNLWNKGNEMLTQQLATSGVSRASIDTLSRMATIGELLSKLEATQASSGGWDSMTLDEKAQCVLDTPGLPLKVLDGLVRGDYLKKVEEASASIAGQHTDSIH